MSKRIGILGGTFNPIHLGHLVMAETARQQFKLDKVLFIPSATPPHKKSGDLPAATMRLAMVRWAIEGNEAFETSDIEIQRAGKSYSYDTLKQLKESALKDQFFFIIGSDSLQDIGTWYRVDDLKKLCSFIIVERPQEHGKTVCEMLKKMSAQDRRYFGRYVLEQFPVGISSHEIRQRVRRGLSVRYLVSGPVEGFIRKSGLYKSQGSR